MQLKDYYSILEISPTASADEIKKAYRRLAHLYHPDKKQNDSYSSAQFSSIKEAYEILSNPGKKDHYLQQRWYAQSLGRKMKQETITPVNVLKQMLELENYVSKLDPHRMYHEGLYDHICSLLNDSTIVALNSFNEPDINKEIIQAAIKSSRLLPYRRIPAIAERLTKFAGNDELMIGKIARFIRLHKQTDYWEKRKIWIALLIVLLICLGIFFSSNN